MFSISIVNEELKDAFTVYRLCSLYFYFSGLSLRKATAAMKDYSIFLCFIKRNHYVSLWNWWWIQKYEPKKRCYQKENESFRVYPI